jgi:signal transduction histidine kinase
LIDLEAGETRIVAQHGETPAAVTAMFEAANLPHPDRDETLTVPIQREGRVIGVIGLDRTDRNAFPPEAFAFVSRLADHAAIAIENARLYDVVKRANQAKSEFVSVMTHEMRIPMTAIKGYADMIGMVGQLSDQQKNFLTIIRNNIDRMTVLVNDLSDISRIESGQLALDIQEGIEPMEVLDEILPALKSEIERRGHTLPGYSRWTVPRPG